ncbi:hypothetical protein C8R43DRAFT_948328 [Mycena crocata]|nr:hypothetical protein C8R43DRAFT_948328 [Mycena crocata]
MWSNCLKAGLQYCSGYCPRSWTPGVTPVLCISACKDSQSAYEDKDGKSLTGAFVNLLNVNPQPSLAELMHACSEKSLSIAGEMCCSPWHPQVSIFCQRSASTRPSDGMAVGKTAVTGNETGEPGRQQKNLYPLTAGCRPSTGDGRPDGFHVVTKVSETKPSNNMKATRQSNACKDHSGGKWFWLIDELHGYNTQDFQLTRQTRRRPGTGTG